MAHTSPATFLVWAIASSMLGSFLLYHLYRFDKYKCLKWDHGPNSGAFKRIMTYSYILSVPCIFGYSLGFAIIKYREGWVAIPLTGVIMPKPYTTWSTSAQFAIFPLSLLFSLGWALEMITHLEELCFWYFLVNSGAAQKGWFRTIYFKIWAGGSIVALVYMPVTAILTRSNHLRSEAIIFLAGSLGSFILTVCFLPVLWKFPSFLHSLKREQVDSVTITRLTKFHELNTIRVVFRFLFCCPLMVLGIDGVRPHVHTINENMFWTDFLAIISAFGVVISSGITLIIFFPRDIGNEIASRDAAKEKKRLPTWIYRRSFISGSNAGQEQLLSSMPSSISRLVTDAHPFMPLNGETSMSQPPSAAFPPSHRGHLQPWDEREEELERPETPIGTVSTAATFRPNRRTGDDIELGGIGGTLTLKNLSWHEKSLGGVNPAIYNYTSPIDLVSRANTASDAGSRFTFGRR